MKATDINNRHQKPFVPNSLIPFTLGLNGKILRGRVVLDGTVVIAGGTASGTIAGEGGPVELVKRVIVRANPAGGSRYPGGKIVDCSARSLLRYAIAQRSKFLGDLGAATLGNGDAGTYTVHLEIPIYWADPNFRRQVATALNADPAAYQAIQVEVQTGDLTSCFTGNDRTATWNGLSVQWVDERNDLAGDTLVLVQEDHTALIPAAQARFEDGAMPKDGTFLQWHILTETGGPNPRTLADTVLNRLTAEGAALDLDLYSKNIRQIMFDDFWYDAAQTATGQYFVDFCDGLISRAVAAADLQAKFDVNNPSGANQDGLHIYTRRLFAPNGYNPNSMAEYTKAA